MLNGENINVMLEFLFELRSIVLYFINRYNAHGFMPLSQWFETEKGIIQTGETGDVTLTSKLLSHQRTLGR